MDKSRAQFQVKRASMGERLIWRYPGRHPEVRRQLLAALAPAGVRELPASITVGYYRRLDDPPGAIAFMPLNSPQALAALTIESVQERICEDLRLRAGGAADGR